MPRNYSITDVENWNFQQINLPPDWAVHLGELTENFRMLIQGPSGHGKTEYVIQFCKMMAQHYGKVLYNSVEQGKSSTLKLAIQRNNMNEVKGKFMICGPDKRIFENWFKNIECKGSGRLIVLDSIDYMNLTVAQFKKLHERFPKKSIAMVCWDDPMDVNAKKIKYMCDLKVEVSEYRAKVRSRFGGNKTFIIWQEGYDKIVKEKIALRMKEREEREKFKAQKEAEKHKQKATPLFEEQDGNSH